MGVRACERSNVLANADAHMCTLGGVCARANLMYVCTRAPIYLRVYACFLAHACDVTCVHT